MTDTMTPAPGPELTLGGPSRVGQLSADTLAAISRAASEAAGESTETEGTPTPEKATPESKGTPAAKVATPPAEAKQGDAKAEAKPEKPEKDAPAKPKDPKQLREAYEKAQARVSELENSYTSTAKEKADAYAKLAELEAKNKGYEERIAKEFEPALQRLTETEKKLQEREEVLRMRDYTATSEWHERYVKPIVDVQEQAKVLLGELVVTVDGKETAAGMEHLNYVIGAPNALEAHRRAEQLFGPFASKLVDYRTQLRHLENKRQEALKSAQLESAEWQKRTQQQQAEQQSKFKAAVQSRVERYLPKPQDTDAEAVAAFNEGQKLADLIANGRPDITPEDAAEAVAKAHTRIVDYEVKALQVKRLEATVAELRQRLQAFEQSEPDVETRRGGEPASATEDGRNTEERLRKALTEKALAMARNGR